MNEKRIFCYWSLPGSMPGYLELCVETWKANLPGYDIVVMNHSTVGDYVGDSYDMDLLRRYHPPQLKDAVMMALLYRHGGIFMDVDTLAVSDIAPLVSQLANAELVIVWRYFAFMAARPGSLLLGRCVDRVRERLERTGTPGPELEFRWGYLGNEPFAEVLEGMTGNLAGIHQAAAHATTRVLDAPPPHWRKKLLLYRILTGLDRLAVERWRLMMDAFHPGLLAMLDRDAHGFLPERLRFPRVPIRGDEKYRAFWFKDHDVRMRDVFHFNQPLIALHNSWTPKWYARLSAEQVLSDDCLLSRTLKRLIG